ncbi:carbon storage regulator [Neorhodopirellula lusitana]|uniref:carbon storage regulator n=1 Tax=Neorhodopirellula lusitana TaxID=445327 RepID=UPI003850315D
MLVLSRKQGQRVVVSFGGELATIEVLRIDGNRVRLGIAAANTIGIYREEVWADMGFHLGPDSDVKNTSVKTVT